MAPHTLTNSEKIQNLTIKPKNHGNHLRGHFSSFFFFPGGDTIIAAASCETLKKLN
jgi:hypothetical protein